MELMLEQMPIVIPALNTGFLQTLKLFIVTLAGSLPLGLVIAFGTMSKFKPLSLFTKLVIWIIRGTPLMIQLLIIYYFPGLVMDNQIWGAEKPEDFWQQQLHLFLIMPAILRKFIVAESRVCRWDRKKQGWYLA